MRLIDANIILRYLLHDNEQQYALAEDAIQAGSFTTAEVIAEVVYVLMSIYKVSRRDISWAIHCILIDIKVENLRCMRYALGLFNQTNLDFVDCLLVAYHKIADVEILSFDKKLNSALEKDFHIYQCDVD